MSQRGGVAVIAALAALAALAAAGGRVPLAGPSNESGRQPAGGCAAYRAQLDEHAAGTVRGDAIRLRLARCLRAAGENDEAAAAYRALLTRGPLSSSPTLLEEASAFFETRSIPPDDTFDAAWTIAPARDRERRDALARVLLRLARHGDPGRKARAIDRLWLELPDTASARALLATPEGKVRAASATRTEAIGRARALLAAPDPPGALAALEPFAPAAEDTTSAACEARVLLARTLRRVGRSSEATAAARLAARHCDSGPAAEALYLLATVQAGKEIDPEADIEEFLRRFPHDSRCDDLLLQRAELLARNEAFAASARVLRRMLGRYPSGDMSHEARFLAAFQHARAGDQTAALRLLDADARLAPPGDVADRAAYWAARLRLFPKLDRLDPVVPGATGRRGTAELSALAASRFGSYYGLLARLLLTRVPGVAASEPSRSPGRAELSNDATVPLPDRLASDPRFTDAAALVASGFATEARDVLDLVRDRLDSAASDPERLALAAAYRSADAATRSYQVLSPAGGRPGVVPPRTQDPDALAAWTLLFPLLFSNSLSGAATKAGIPPVLLHAVVREESTFDPAAVSRTGAVGLCQIQGPAAQEAAAILGRAVPSRDELLDPAVNATIGATYLRKRLDSMHPLAAIAAYNRGPTSIGALVRKLGAIPIDTFIERIPARETRDYVKRVAGSWDAYAALDDPGGQPSFPILLPSKR